MCRRRSAIELTYYKAGLPVLGRDGFAPVGASPAAEPERQAQAHLRRPSADVQLTQECRCQDVQIPKRYELVEGARTAEQSVSE